MATSSANRSGVGSPALANAMRELAHRCANEGWAEQAAALYHEAEVISGEPIPVLSETDRFEPECTAPMTIEVTHLGRFQVLRGGELFPFCHSARALWVWRYLLSRPHFMAHKGDLASRLWPNTGGDRAHHSLHVAVAALREFLGDRENQIVAFANDCYVLQGDLPIRQDTDRFQCLVERGKQLLQEGAIAASEETFAAALKLYTGDYDISGLDFAWAIVEQRKHAATYLEALEHAGAIAFDQQRFGQAILQFRRILTRDPYREDVLAKLMIAFHHLGRRGDAAREYARCALLLQRDLNIEPSQELKGVYRTFLGAEPPDSPARFLQVAAEAEPRIPVRILTLDDEALDDPWPSPS